MRPVGWKQGDQLGVSCIRQEVMVAWTRVEEGKVSERRSDFGYPLKIKSIWMK